MSDKINNGKKNKKPQSKKPDKRSKTEITENVSTAEAKKQFFIEKSKQEINLLTPTIASILKTKTGKETDIITHIVETMVNYDFEEEKTIETLHEALESIKYKDESYRQIIAKTYEKYDAKERMSDISDLLQLLEEVKDKYGKEYEKIKKALSEIFKPRPHKYRVILKKYEEWGTIEDSTPDREGTIIYWKRKEKRDYKGNPVMDEQGKFVFENISRELVQFNGKIRVCKLDDSTTGILLNFDDEDENSYTVDDAIIHITQHYGVMPSKKQRLISIFRRLALQYGNDAPLIKPEPPGLKRSKVRVIDGKIHIDFNNSGFSNEDILRKIYNYTEMFASNPEALIATFSWNLLAPLHYHVKTLGYNAYVPYLILSGMSKGGKTSLGELFISKGYAAGANSKVRFEFHSEEIATKFTLMTNLTATNLPALFDELGMDFFNLHKKSLKGYASKGIFGEKGTSSQSTNLYTGLRSFMVTMNEDFDRSVDLALGGRAVIASYTEYNTMRKNRQEFTKFFNSLPDNFMFSLLKEALEGVEIKDIVAVLQQYEKPDEWIDEGIYILNILAAPYGFQFPAYKTLKSSASTIAFEIAENMANEYTSHIFNDEFHRSPYYGKLVVEETEINHERRKMIYFHGSTYRLILKNYGYKFHEKATEYIRNIPADDFVKVEFGGKSVPKKINGEVVRVYCVSIPIDSDSHPIFEGNNNSTDDKGTEKGDGNTQKEVSSQSSLERQEDLENEKAKSREKHLNSTESQEKGLNNNAKTEERILYYRSKTPYTGAFIDGFKRSEFFYYKITTIGLDDGTKQWISWVTTADSILEATFNALQKAIGSEMMPRE